MRATPRPGVTLRDLLPEGEAIRAPIAEPRRCLRQGRQRRCCWSKTWSRNIRARARPARCRKLFGANKPVPESAVFRAVDGISFPIARGESVGLVGESGCGKSTTSMMVMRLIDKTAGRIIFDGEDIGEIPARQFATLPLAQAHPDGVPGPDRQPQSALHRGARHRRSAAAAGQSAARQGAGALRGTGARRSACRSNCSTASRISSRAGRRRASASRAPSRSSPTSSSSTSRPPRSTSRCRRWCSICCRT